MVSLCTLESAHMKSLIRRLSSVAILASFVGLGWLGHKTHWQIPGLAGHAQEKTVAAQKEPARESAPKAAIAKAPVAAQTVSKQTTTPQAGDLPLPPDGTTDHIRLARAIERPWEDVIKAHAEVLYDRTRVADIGARVPGIVWAVCKKVGDTVRKGEPIVLLDSAEIGKAKANYLQARVECDLRRHHLQRLESIPNVVPERQLREAMSAVRESRVARYNTRQAMINLGIPVAEDALKDLSDEECASRIQFLGVPADIVATLDPATATANLIPMIAPFDGIVIRQDLVEGEGVEPMQPRVTVADLRNMWLQLDVRKEDAMRLSLDQTVTFETEGMPAAVEGRIDWIGTEVDETTRTVQARAVLDNPVCDAASGSRRLRAHSYGTADIAVRSSPVAVLVPSTAVQWTGNEYVVFVPSKNDDDNFDPRPIRPGSSRDGWTEVLSGISSGEPVVTVGSHALKSELGRQRLANAQALR